VDPTIYLDNAATTFPKPEPVYAAVDDCLRRYGVSPGRSGADLAVAAGERVQAVRAALDRLFANPAGDPDRVVFTANATDALNLALQGLCRPGDHVVATVLDHNSVLRPLHELAAARRLEFDLAPAGADGRVDPEAIAALLRPQTRLVVATHASNVFGTVQDAAAVGALCRARGVLFVLDAAQSAGQVPVDMGALRADVVVFTGHKSLLGPMGVGGLVLGPGVEPEPIRWGGTGVRSALLTQPRELPHRLETGTPNLPGLVGLLAGLTWLQERGRPALHAAETALCDRLRDGLTELPGLRLLHARGGARVPVLSCVLAGMDAEEVGARLDVDHGVIVRTGLHCAPLAHVHAGTSPRGAVRFSFGPCNRDDDVDRTLDAMRTLAATAARRR
jgi:cysteine desulfurase family protein